MYLKKIEIVGFKSFADKTEVTFERGVTCVVGPNGCGKSNISDSIRWVLGERSPKLLRGSKMEDVIFSGTDFRKPLNFAEVSLTIDNADQKLAIQYEEVVITRRLHRSGDSEYLLNKTPCRLKDIQDLILDTGIGSNSYSMIEQGRIDYILNAEADERRSLIEEAAGISKFKVKKEEAIRKLERTEENLLRINDIVSEVERNIKYAERQAQRAEKFKDQFELLKKYETQKAFYELGKINNELESLENEIETQAASLKELETTLQNQNAEMHDLENKLHGLEETFLEREGARSEVLRELTSIENHQQFHTERIEFLKMNSEKTLGEIETINKNLTTLRSEISIRQNELAQLNQAISNLIGNKDVKLSEQQALIFDLATQISAMRNTLSDKKLELASLERAQLSLKETRAKLAEHEASIKNRFDVTDDKRTDHELNLSNSRNALAETVQKQEELESSIKNSEKHLEQFRNEITKLQSQLDLLQELDHANGLDAKTIIREHADEVERKSIKALLDLIQVEPGYEVALEAVLHESVKGVVTENAGTAFRVFEQLKQKGSSRATIFIKEHAVLNGSLTPNLEVSQHPLVHKRLWDVIKVEKEYEGVLGNLIGNAHIIEEPTQNNITELIKLAGQTQLVSKSGSVLGPQYQLSLRSGGFTPEKSVLARNEEKKRLEHDIRNLMTREGFTINSLKEEELSLVEVKKKRTELQDQILNHQVLLERMHSTSQAFSERLGGIQEELELLNREEHQNVAQIEKLGAEKHILSEKLAEFEKQEIQIKSLIEHLQKSEELTKAVEFFSKQGTELENRVQTLNQERSEAYEHIGRLESELRNYQQKETETRQILLERSVETEQIKRDRAKTIEERNQKLEQIQHTSKALDESKQHTHEYSLKQMEFGHQKQSIHERLQSRYKIALSGLNSEDFTIDAEEFERIQPEIEKLSEKLDAIGTVNLLAIDEYHELKTRYDFLITQKNDLVQSRDTLLETIRKINRTTKKLFEETLTRVRENFHRYFRDLFGGGQADLVLLDVENPTDSGLDIVARPPGKKLQHITLLSGGEKALTAIALLLSLFSVRPSPFCVLDEVDAPLDEANNERFVTALKPFLTTTQFIIVTHSRKTIAMGDALYGVTMQEPGVSKLVSVKLSHDQQGIEHTDQKLATELNQVLT